MTGKRFYEVYREEFKVTRGTFPPDWETFSDEERDSWEKLALEVDEVCFIRSMPPAQTQTSWPVPRNYPPPAAANTIAPEPEPVRNESRPIWELVIEDMKARDQFGRKKYRMPLQAGNGRDALRDAYQEALDLCAYLRQAIEERDNP